VPPGRIRVAIMVKLPVLADARNPKKQPKKPIWQKSDNGQSKTKPDASRNTITQEPKPNQKVPKATQHDDTTTGEPMRQPKPLMTTRDNDKKRDEPYWQNYTRCSPVSQSVVIRICNGMERAKAIDWPSKCWHGECCETIPRPQPAPRWQPAAGTSSVICFSWCLLLADRLICGNIIGRLYYL
jgi:hypothetical protein